MSAAADRRFRRQLFVHLSYLTSACPCGPALRCYQLALFEQLGATLARVKDEPKLAHECLTSALAALLDPGKRSLARISQCQSVCSRIFSGAQGRNRTTDTCIFSAVLYQLSYLGAASADGGMRAAL
jgi:hypothetical protein